MAPWQKSCVVSQHCGKYGETFEQDFIYILLLKLLTEIYSRFHVKFNCTLQKFLNSTSIITRTTSQRSQSMDMHLTWKLSSKRWSLKKRQNSLRLQIQQQIFIPSNLNPWIIIIHSEIFLNFDKPSWKNIHDSFFLSQKICTLVWYASNALDVNLFFQISFDFPFLTRPTNQKKR